MTTSLDAKLWPQASPIDASTSIVEVVLSELQRALPCHVVSVSGSIVTVAFDVANPPVPLPQVTIPKAESTWLRSPTQVGDKGIVLAADAYLEPIAGMASGTASFTRPSTYGGLVFVPVSQQPSPPDDPNAAQVTGPTGARIRDTASTVVTRVGGGAIRTTGNLNASQNISAGSAVQGAVSTLTGNIVSFSDGIATELAGPTATSFLNADYFANFVTEAEGVQNGDDLQELVFRSMGNIQGLTTACSTIQSALSGLEQLFTAPEADPTAIVSWITSFIPFLKQMYAASTNAVSMAAALPEQTASVVAAIEAAEARLHVTVIIPPITT